jgi:hypothetical protein
MSLLQDWTIDLASIRVPGNRRTRAMTRAAQTANEYGKKREAYVCIASSFCAIPAC